MADVTFISSTLPALVAEIARRVVAAEAALTSPVSRISITFGNGVLTIAGFVNGALSTIASDGTLKFSPTDHTPGNTPILTGTPLASKGIDSLAEALVVAASELQSAEDTYLADGTKTLPTGVDVSCTVNGLQAVISAAVPFNVNINSSGQQVITVPNYLA